MSTPKPEIVRGSDEKAANVADQKQAQHKELEMAELEAGESRSSSEETKKPALKYDKPSWWARVPFIPMNQPPPKYTLETAPLTPEASANFLSLITFQWIWPMMELGYGRPLEAGDLWRLQDSRSSAVIAEKIATSFARRRKDADEYNKRLLDGEINPSAARKLWWSIRGNREEREKQWRTKDAKKHPSLVYAMNDAVFWWFWLGGILAFISAMAQITSPLIVKEIINFVGQSYAVYQRDPNNVSGLIPPIGKGIGLVFGMLGLQLVASVGVHNSFYRGASTGVMLRGGLISAIYDLSLRLTTKARSTLTNGRLVNHISTDVSRIDFCAQFFHIIWTSPFQLLVCLALLIINLGPSALAGFAFFIFGLPIQTLVMGRMFMVRRQAMVWTDKRAKLLQELLGGMRVIKYFTWELPFVKRIGEYRTNEIKAVRSLLIIRSANNAVAFSLPTLAAVVSFIVYAASGHQLDASIIFTSLTLFNLLRIPMMVIPMGFSALADARNAVERLVEVFMAETKDDTRVIDPSLDVAIEIKGATFSWDSVLTDTAPTNPKAKGGKPGKPAKAPKNPNKAKKGKGAKGSTEEPAAHVSENPFQLDEVNLSIPRGQLVAIVGAVGSGKSSLLQGLIGEMRRVQGSVTFGGSVGYCAQTAWIQNATVRENICFGRPFEEQRYWAAVRASCLGPDLDMLPHGDATEVGEKGISLSGGQKQRMNICRALYLDTDIVIFDDPFSALDAHVGGAVFKNVLQSALRDRTRVIVTHALHFLPQVDRIITMVDGKIAEQGTHAELMKANGAFAQFVKEFGSIEDQNQEEQENKEVDDGVKKDMVHKPGHQLMQAEERNTGSVDGQVYMAYFKYANGAVLLPLLLASLVFLQGANVMSGYWLVFWQQTKWPYSQGFYMGIYAALGVLTALGFFLMGGIFALLTFYASRGLHQGALNRVMHAPMSFFETTPLGRILNRFAKDIDTIDNTLGDAMRMLANTTSQIIGSIVLIAIALPYFLIPVAVISLGYYWMAMFYRSSARELKRLDAILRSSLYSHFSESLSGLGTIRAYGEMDRFRKDNQRRIDIENRAYILTVTNQRFLGIRLDFCGILLTFSVGILAVTARFEISASITGLALSYVLGVQQAFGWLVRQSAEVENDMNGVERLLHYTNEIEQEPPHEIPEHKPAPEWPSQGQISLNKVVMSYRAGLPPVLKGLSMNVKGGEKIGIVGRTGAGKSSIMSCLFRLVELDSGSIEIDGIDIKTLGLKDLRSRLAIPQDALLYSGTMRSNLDPFGLHDDSRLNDALRRAHLIELPKTEQLPASGSADGLLPSGAQTPIPSGAHTPLNRFSLDTPIDEDGANLSVGQRSLVSLARALVVDAKINILDEATASVDYETDHKIQMTIAREFKDRTILCIAHRLRTILSYDRICVMDAGNVVEMDNPEALFHLPGGIFRSMCDRSSITLEDIQTVQRNKLD